MSQSSLPKNAPDFLRQENLDKALDILRQPFSLAILASLGIHALLGVVLPMLPSKDTKPADHSVQVVELSPADQARIPEFDKPLGNTPSISNPTKLPNQVSKTPLTKTPPSIFDDSLYNFPTLPSPPVSLPSLDDFIRLPANTRRQPIGVVPPRESNQTSSQKPSGPAAKPSPSSDSAAKPSETNTPTDTRTQTRPDKIPQAAVDRLRELQNQKRVAQQPQDQPQGVAATQSEAVGKLMPWLQRIAQSEKVDVSLLVDELWKSKKQSLTVACPISSCSDKVAQLPTVPSFIVVVKPDGKIVDPPAQTPTGNKELDRAALTGLMKFESNLKPTGSYQVYQFRVQFEDQKKT